MSVHYYTFTHSCSLYVLFILLLANYRDIVEKANDNLRIGQELVGIINKVEETEMKILDDRLRYKNILNIIHGNWTKLDGESSLPVQNDAESEEVKK